MKAPSEVNIGREELRTQAELRVAGLEVDRHFDSHQGKLAYFDDRKRGAYLVGTEALGVQSGFCVLEADALRRCGHLSMPSLT